MIPRVANSGGESLKGSRGSTSPFLALVLSFLLVLPVPGSLAFGESFGYRAEDIVALLAAVKPNIESLPQYSQVLSLLYTQEKRATDLGKRFLALYAEEPKLAGELIDLLLMELTSGRRTSQNSSASLRKPKPPNPFLIETSLFAEPIFAAPVLLRIFDGDQPSILGYRPQLSNISYPSRSLPAMASRLRSRASLWNSLLPLRTFKKPRTATVLGNVSGRLVKAASAFKTGLSVGWRVATRTLFRAAGLAALVVAALVLPDCAIPREPPPSRQQTGCRAGECHGFEIAGHPDLALWASPASGSHTTHVTRTQCERCHDTYDNRHYNGKIETEGLVFNGIQTGLWNDRSQTCSNTSCHGTGGWGEANPSCTMCHGEEGPRGVPRSGSHTPHLTNVANDCQSCHFNYQVNPSHRNGSVDASGLVRFNSANPSGAFDEARSGCSGLGSACHGSGGAWGDTNPPCSMCHGPSGILPTPTSGSHTTHVAQMSQDCQTCHNGYRTNSSHRDGSLNANNSIQFNSQNPYASYAPQTQTCGNLSCHGTGTWGQTNPSCAMCHREGGPAPNPVLGSHQVHLTRVSSDCSLCHSDYQTQPSHRDGVLDSSGLVHFNTLNGSANYNEGTSGCSDLNCHGNGTWGDTNPACAMCHGPGGLLSNPSSGSHTIHLSKATTECPTCHSSYQVQSTHRDRLPTSSGLVRFNSANPSGAFDEARSGCSGLGSGCHGSGTWGDTNPLCAMCHGPEGMQPSWNTGSHAKHVGELSYICSDCHHDYANSSNHRNNTFEASSSVQFDSKNPSGNYTAPSQTCNSLYCHGPEPSQVAPRWGGSLNCGDCHKVPPSSGSHPRHTYNNFSDPSNVQYNFACSECHSASGLSGHVNFQTDVLLRTDNEAQATGYGRNGGNTPSFDSSNRSCSNVYCHSNGVSQQRSGSYGEADIGSLPSGTLTYNTPAWGGSVDCGECHAAKPLGQIASPSDYPATGAHQFAPHIIDWIGWPASQGFAQCFWCHGGATSRQGSYGSSQHVDGELNFHPYSDTNGGTIWSQTGRSYQDGHCGASCHW